MKRIVAAAAELLAAACGGASEGSAYVMIAVVYAFPASAPS
jgi:hypothetical protein